MAFGQTFNEDEMTPGPGGVRRPAPIAAKPLLGGTTNPGFGGSVFGGSTPNPYFLTGHDPLDRGKGNVPAPFQGITAGVPTPTGTAASPIGGSIFGSPTVPNGVTPYALPGNTSSKNLQNVMAQTFNYDIGTQANLLNQVEGKLDFSNLQNSPLYRADLAGANEGTSSAYDAAMANVRRNAMSRGFGYANPLEQGGETQLRGQEASELGRNPSRALLQTVQPELQSASILSNDMSQFNPDALMASWADLVKGKSAAGANMLSSLMKAITKIPMGGGGGGSSSGSDDAGDSGGSFDNAGGDGMA